MKSWFPLMILAHLISCTGDILVKQHHPMIGALLYASTAPLWVRVLNQCNLSYIAIISAVVGNIILLAGAHLFLGETLTVKQWFGFLTGLLTLWLMN